ncbi:transmembrane protein 179B [Anolis carolinensis]|uniref:transmembrane protein 179B n=1 Tax=Anolis carolinensis TaxID=28377 RepID=UPI002F2B7E55
MPPASGLLLAGLALSAASFLCGVICASALTVTQGEFGGRCILYGSVSYNGSITLSASSPPSLCRFVSAVSILTSVLSFVVLIRGIYSTCFGDGTPDSGVWLKGSLAVSAGVLFFLMISACILRVGMDALCASIHRAAAALSCQEAQHQKWVPPIRPERFYDNLYTAEAAAWVNFFFWCLMIAMLCVSYFGESPSRTLRVGGQSDEAAPIIGSLGP